MPNHITNKLKASPEVIKQLINEDGEIDFSKILPWAGSFEWDGVNCRAETCAQVAVGAPLDDHPLIAMMQSDNRNRCKVQDLSAESFAQYEQMVRNYRETGFMHRMDFAREKWGTKWNAYSQDVDADNGAAGFETAWSCPFPVFAELSRLNPGELIEVQYADEDIGSNCGTVHFMNGEEVFRDCAGRWDDMSEEEQAKWKAFAYMVTGREPYEDEE